MMMTKSDLISCIFFLCMCYLATSNQQQGPIKSLLTNLLPQKIAQTCRAGAKPEQRAGRGESAYRWSNAEVPFVIDGTFPQNERANIFTAMKQIQSVTCVTFMRRTNETNYVYFNYGGEGCDSSIGMWIGGQLINLAPGDPGYESCGQRVDTIEHEIMHALGFYHEMCRPDRDQYVEIHWDNVIEDQKYNFEVKKNQITFGIPFDYQSLMMYKWNDFAIDRTKPTITAKKFNNFDTKFDNRKLSKNDIAAINAMYHCH